MGRLKSFGRGVLIGIKMGLTPGGAAQLKVAGVEYTAEAAKVCEELATEERSYPCEEVRRIIEHNGTQARKYQRSVRGTARYIPSSGDGRCRKWLKGYYLWNAKLFKEESEEISETPLINVPDLPSFPKLPDIGGVKRSLQVSAVVIIGVVLLIVYMLTGRGRKGVTVVT